MAKLQVVCVTSLTGDDLLDGKAAEDSLAVRREAHADVKAVCARSLLLLQIRIILTDVITWEQSGVVMFIADHFFPR